METEESYPLRKSFINSIMIGLRIDSDLNAAIKRLKDVHQVDTPEFLRKVIRKSVMEAIEFYERGEGAA